jgi:AcrR family transcriptional regulator
MAALLDALDRLLRDRPFESITVLELAQAAGVSTGAFYARFASKEDLLPQLYKHFQDSLEETSNRELDPSGWGPLSAQERLDRVAQFLCDSYENRSWLLRAVAIHSRRRYSAVAQTDATPTAQVRWLRKLADCLVAAPSPWADVSRDQLEFALYTAITLAREAILFPHLPMATALGLNATSMRQRLPSILQQQLNPRTL